MALRRRPTRRFPGLSAAGIGGYLVAVGVAAAAPTVPEAPVVAAIPVVVLFVPDLPARDSDDVLAASISAQVDPKAVDLRVLRYDPSQTTARGAIRSRSRRASAEFAAGGVLWIRLATSPGKPHAIFLYEVETDRLLGRRVPVQVDSPAAAIEIVANIAGSVVAESVNGSVAALEEVDPETLEPETETEEKTKPETDPTSRQPKPGPERPPESFARVWVMAAYAGNTFSDAVMWQNAVALGGAWSPVPGAFLGVRYDVVFATRIRLDDLQVTIRRHPVTLEGGYRFTLNDRFDVEFFGRATVDPTTRTTTGGGTPTQLRVFSGAGGGIGLGYRPIRQLRLAVRAGADALLTRAAYVYDDAGTQAVALNPHPARFLVETGVHYGLLWRARQRRNNL